MNIKQISQLLLAILICQMAGLIGTNFTTPNIDTWYAALEKPFFQPPNYLFGPVWITLYTLMGISLYLIWQQGWHNERVKNAIILFLIHLLFNTSWSIIFFGFQNITLGLINIIFLWAFIGFLIFKFYKIDKSAALLLIPYFAWVTFATVLNAAIWNLNFSF